MKWVEIVGSTLNLETPHELLFIFWNHVIKRNLICQLQLITWYENISRGISFNTVHYIIAAELKY